MEFNQVKMQEVFFLHDNMISSQGFSSEINFQNCYSGKSGVVLVDDKRLSRDPVPLSIVDSEELLKRFSALSGQDDYTRYEQLSILSIHDVVTKSGINPRDPDTLLILSTTKGNIDLLEQPGRFDKERIMLWKSAEIIAEFFGFVNTPIVISNACISGVLAVNYAAELISEGKYKNIVVSGADILSEFVVSGFQSFKAISPTICRPFDANRDGITIGEGCGTILLSSEAGDIEKIVYLGGGSSNDANHISGPSRTGDGLAMAIANAMRLGGKAPEQIDFISAHGTATPYNDEMEAKALTLCGLQSSPVNSLKGYFGHTLGAAGILEIIISLQSLRKSKLVGTFGYKDHGVSVPLNVIQNSFEKEIKTVLKTASGFGGCNAAVVFEKKNMI